MQETEPAVCLRCSETYLRAAVHLRSVMQLNKIPASKRVAALMALEGLDSATAEAWLKHEMHKSCEKREADCPRCGGRLITWQARWCQHCKLDWH